MERSQFTSCPAVGPLSKAPDTWKNTEQETSNEKHFLSNISKLNRIMTLIMSNYRPISILPCVSKIAEKWVSKLTTKHLDKKQEIKRNSPCGLTGKRESL